MFSSVQLKASFPPESPTAAFLSRRSPEIRSSPSRCLYSGRHSEGTLSRKVQLIGAIVDSSLCYPQVVTSWIRWSLEAAGLVLRERSPALANP